jgi:membrane-associated phospholipid phosphatase
VGVEREAGPALPLELWRALLPVEKLELWFLAALCAIAALRAPAQLPWLAAAAAAIVAARACAGRGRMAGAVADFLPVAIGIFLLNASGPLIAAGAGERWDTTFAALDRRLFGAFAVGWRMALGRPAWLTDLASLFYVAYYALPVAVGGALYLAGRRAEFAAVALAVVATLLASYGCYFLWPTAGPRVPLGLEQQILGGGSISIAVRAFLHWAERNQYDAFPSGHTAVTLAVLTSSWRPLPRWRLPLACCAAGILFATVYLSLHYVVDLVAGAALATSVALAIALWRPVPARARA